MVHREVYIQSGSWIGIPTSALLFTPNKVICKRLLNKMVDFTDLCLRKDIRTQIEGECKQICKMYLAS